MGAPLSPYGLRSQLLGLVADLSTIALGVIVVLSRDRVDRSSAIAVICVFLAVAAVQSVSRWVAVKAAPPEERDSVKRIAIIGTGISVVTVGAVMLVLMSRWDG